VTSHDQFLRGLPHELRAPRILPVALVGAILAGTAVAFVLTEQAKLRHALVTDTRVDKQFSPSCHCRQDVARIAFRLPRPDRITLQLVNSVGQPVTQLVHNRLLSAGFKRFRWNGRNAHGTVLPNGAYRPEVIFALLHRTIVLPSPIKLDTTPPRLEHASIHVVGRRLLVQYLFDKPAQALLLIDGHLAELTRSSVLAGRLEWAETFPNGRHAARGRHRILLAGIDLAGNRSHPSGATVVHLR